MLNREETCSSSLWFGLARLRLSRNCVRCAVPSPIRDGSGSCRNSQLNVPSLPWKGAKPDPAACFPLLQSIACVLHPFARPFPDFTRFLPPLPGRRRPHPHPRHPFGFSTPPATCSPSTEGNFAGSRDLGITEESLPSCSPSKRGLQRGRGKGSGKKNSEMHSVFSSGEKNRWAVKGR